MQARLTATRAENSACNYLARTSGVEKDDNTIASKTKKGNQDILGPTVKKDSSNGIIIL